MEKFKSLEHLKAQVTVVRWHLDAASAHGDSDRRRRHLDGASLTYQGAVELLTKLPLPTDEHAALTRQLEELRDKLRAAGQIV